MQDGFRDVNQFLHFSFLAFLHQASGTSLAFRRPRFSLLVIMKGLALKPVLV